MLLVWLHCRWFDHKNVFLNLRRIGIKKMTLSKSDNSKITIRNGSNAEVNKEQDRLIEEWSKKWRDKPETRKAEDLLTRCKITRNDENCSRDQDDLGITHLRIIIACYNAKIYRPEFDASRQWRDEMATAQYDKQNLIDAAKVLMNACRDKSVSMKYAFPLGEQSGVRLSVNSEMEVTDALHVWFEELVDRLDKELPERDVGPFVGNNTFGNFLFSESKRGSGRNTSVDTMLAFALTIYMRLYTSGNARRILQNGELMPDCGRPSSHVVAAFVNATLGRTYDSKQIADLIKEIPAGTGLLLEWRHLV